jgi:hypothetical protein
MFVITNPEWAGVHVALRIFNRRVRMAGRLGKRALRVGRTAQGLGCHRVGRFVDAKSCDNPHAFFAPGAGRRRILMISTRLRFPIPAAHRTCGSHLAQSINTASTMMGGSG